MMMSVLLCVCGLLATYLSLVLDANAWTRVVAPFGWPQLAIAQAITALPLAWWVARRLPPPRVELRQAFLVTSILMGLSLAGLFGFLGNAAGVLLESFGQDFFVRAGFRSLWCVVLLTPWSVAAINARTPARPNWSTLKDNAGDPSSHPNDGHRRQMRESSGAVRERQPTFSQSTAHFAVVAATALALPSLYAYECCVVVASSVREQLGNGRIESALRAVVALTDVGYRGPVLGTNPVRLQETLADQLDAMRSAVRFALPPNATESERIERAMIHVGLRQPTLARELLSGLPDNLDAVLMLALVDQDLENYSSSDADYQHALELASASKLPREQLIEKMRQAYDGLAYNSRQAQRYSAAESYYVEAIRVLPELSGHWHYQLGEHHRLGGRPIQAAEQFRQAVESGPVEIASEAQSRLRELQEQSPACLLWNRRAAP